MKRYLFFAPIFLLLILCISFFQCEKDFSPISKIENKDTLEYVVDNEKSPMDSVEFVMSFVAGHNFGWKEYTNIDDIRFVEGKEYYISTLYFICGYYLEDLAIYRFSLEFEFDNYNTIVVNGEFKGSSKEYTYRIKYLRYGIFTANKLTGVNMLFGEGNFPVNTCIDCLFKIHNNL